MTDSNPTTQHPITQIVGNEKRFCTWGAPDGVAILDGKGNPVGPKAPAYAHIDSAMGWRDSQKWLTLAQASAGVESGKRVGIGIFTSNGDVAGMTPITVIDLDDCVTDGVVVDGWQRDVIEGANTLTTISPSGTGLHLWFIGTQGFTAPEIASVKDNTTRGYEVYSKAHHVRLGSVVMRDVSVKMMTPELWGKIASLLPGWLEEQAAKVIEPTTRKPLLASAHEHTTPVARPTFDGDVETPKLKQRTRPTTERTLREKQIAFVAAKFNETHVLTDILRRHGYSVDDKGNVTRPGKDVREGTSGNIKDGKYWPHSSNDPLKAAMYGNHAHTTFSTWCFYEHSGDEQAAARAAANELGIDLHGNQANGEGSEERPSYGLDDVGNGYRFADQHRKAARWTKAWGWMTYDGKRWRRDDRGAVWLMAKDTAKRIWDEARDVGKSSDDESTQKRANTLAKWAGLSQSREKLSAMLQMAQSELAASTDDFDTDPMLLNVQNGTIDLHTRTLRPHNPDDLITRVCKASYCPDVATPLWNDTLNRFQTSDNIAFLQRSLGLACSGLTDKAFWFFYGASGDNGKSTITATVATVLGDYSARISLEVLTSKRRGPGEEDQLASLAGARMVVGNEVAATALNATLIKDLSGEMDSIKTKFMGQSTFEFRPKFKLFLYGNKKPELDATDPALWNRVNCVPFERSIPKSEQIKNFSAKLAAEYDGILTWLVDGFAAYQHEGLNPPAAVTEATNDYRNEMDTLGQFIAACCVVNPKAQQLVSELREAYEKYSDSKASPKTFGRELKARGFVEGQDGKGRRTYRGIGLLQLPDRLVTEGTEDTEAKPSRAIRENTPNAETSLFPLYPLVPLVGNMEHRKTGKNAGNSESSGEEGTSGKSNHQTVSRQGDPAEKVPTNSKSSVDGKFDSSIIDYLAANGASKASVVAGHAFRQHGIAQHTQSDIDQIEGDIKRLIKSRTLAQLADKTLSLCEVQL